METQNIIPPTSNPPKRSLFSFVILLLKLALLIFTSLYPIIILLAITAGLPYGLGINNVGDFFAIILVLLYIILLEFLAIKTLLSLKEMCYSALYYMSLLIVLYYIYIISDMIANWKFIIRNINGSVGFIIIPLFFLIFLWSNHKKFIK